MTMQECKSCIHTYDGKATSHILCCQYITNIDISKLQIIEKTIFVFHHVLMFCICSLGTSWNWKNTDYSWTPQCYSACSSIKGSNQVIYVLFIYVYVFIVYTSLHNNLMHVGKESLACHVGPNYQLRRSEFFVVIFIIYLLSRYHQFLISSSALQMVLPFL